METKKPDFKRRGRITEEDREIIAQLRSEGAPANQPDLWLQSAGHKDTLNPISHEMSHRSSSSGRLLRSGSGSMRGPNAEFQKRKSFRQNPFLSSDGSLQVHSALSAIACLMRRFVLTSRFPHLSSPLLTSPLLSSPSLLLSSCSRRIHSTRQQHLPCRARNRCRCSSRTARTGQAGSSASSPPPPATGSRTDCTRPRSSTRPSSLTRARALLAKSGPAAAGPRASRKASAGAANPPPPQTWEARTATAHSSRRRQSLSAKSLLRPSSAASMWREQRWKGAREQQEEDRGGTGGRLARMLRCISLSGAACAAKSNRKNRDFRTVLYVKGALMPLISPHSARPGVTLRRSS